tara:strand:+ start:6271 stop:7098 length:828 start_codon:yes stop_codon:yes gene_type:complete
MWGSLLAAMLLLLPLHVEAGTSAFAPALGGGGGGDQAIERVYTWVDYETYAVSVEYRVSNAEGVCMSTQYQWQNYFSVVTTGESVGYPWLLTDKPWIAGTPNGWLYAGCDDLDPDGYYAEWDEDSDVSTPDGPAFSHTYVGHMLPGALDWTWKNYSCMRMRGYDQGTTATHGNTQVGGSASADVVFNFAARDLTAEAMDNDVVTLSVALQADGTYVASGADPMYTPEAAANSFTWAPTGWVEMNSVTNWPAAAGYPNDMFNAQFICMATIEVTTE